MKLHLFASSFILFVSSSWGSEEAARMFETVCAVCHGPKGEGKQELLAPSIAGMPSWYSELQLHKFREGHRGKHHQDVSGAQMRAIALALTPELVPQVAEHIASLPPIPTAKPEGKVDFARGEEIFSTVCAACHRFNGQGEKVFRSAQLTTLQPWYLRESLRKFREGIRGYQHGDLDGPKMRETAKFLGEGDVDHLIAYIAHLAEKYPPGKPRRGHTTE